MGSVILFDAVRMQEIEDSTVVGGFVDTDGHLLLQRRDGDTIDGGNVQLDLHDASPTVKGIARIATDAETITGTDDLTIVTPQNLKAALKDPGSEATTTAHGTVELATSAEVITGTDPARAVTPSGLAAFQVAKSSTFTGIVDPMWNGISTPVSVALDAGQVVTGSVTAIIDKNDRTITPGVQVILARIGGTGGTWYIVKAYPLLSDFLREVAINLQNNWALYNDIQDAAETFGVPRYQMGTYTANGNNSAYAGQIHVSMSRYGVVRVTGLIQNPGATLANGSIIATLPPGMWPAQERDFVVLGNGTSAPVIVDTAGNIRWLTGGTQNAYFSLSNIRFRAKSAVDLGLATFTALLPFMTSGWQAYGGTYWAGGTTSHTPGYTSDPDGVILFEGAVQATAAYAGNAVAGTLTGLGFNYPECSHHLMYAPGVVVGIFRFGTNTATPLTGSKQINFGSALAIGNYVILDNISLKDPTTATSPNILMATQNSWTSYLNGYKKASFALTPDKQLFVHGLFAGGAISTVMATFSTYLRPRYNLIMANLSNGAPARHDFRSPDGGLFQSGGTTAWTSLDGLDYALYNMKF